MDTATAVALAIRIRISALYPPRCALASSGVKETRR
jgi:hypothetical protein